MTTAAHGTTTVLVVDDELIVRESLGGWFREDGYEVSTAASGAEALRAVAERPFDVALLDIKMPGMDGLELQRRLRDAAPETAVIVMTAFASVDTAVAALKAGAYDYIVKPFDPDELSQLVRRATEHRRMREEHPEAAPESPRDLIVGDSPAMARVLDLIANVAPTDATVLIQGESGTGKELVAKAVHAASPRRLSPFVAVHCGALAESLLESELFGHEKGSFTGALTRSSGRFEQAAGGTLFLDEIGDMPIEAQTRLLRVLQEGEYTRVGGRTPIRADARIIAATHRDLRQLVRQGLFREDLFYRLNVVPVRLPPLRERPEDIPDLVRHFLTEGRAEGLPEKTLEGAAMDRLKAHAWPGNVRELENLVRRLAVLYSEDVIGVEVIGAELADGQTPSPAQPQAGESLGAAAARQLKDYFDAHKGGLPPAGLYDRVMREVERPLILLSLEATRGNQLRAARLLGLNRNTLRKKIRELDIPVVRGLK